MQQKKTVNIQAYKGQSAPSPCPPSLKWLQRTFVLHCPRLVLVLRLRPRLPMAEDVRKRVGEGSEGDAQMIMMVVGRRNPHKIMASVQVAGGGCSHRARMNRIGGKWCPESRIQPVSHHNQSPTTLQQLCQRIKSFFLPYSTNTYTRRHTHTHTHNLQSCRFSISFILLATFSYLFN